jgi:hypothetical protein
MTPERNLLRKIGLDVQEATGGCCGLAGSWGFEQGKYDISMQCGEQGLLPGVRQAAPDTVVVANGFSCQTQLEQAGTGRGALHVAQVLKLARERGPIGWTAGAPEPACGDDHPAAPRAVKAKRIAGLAVLGAVMSGAIAAGVKLAGR